MAECPEYVAWKERKYMSLTPWKKLDNSSLSLIRKILVDSPSARYKISDIKQHRWFVTSFVKGSILDQYFRKMFKIFSIGAFLLNCNFC